MFNNPMYGDEEWTPSTVRGINAGSPDEEFDNTPEARIAFAERAFKSSSSRSDRRAAFNDAFRAARQAGMQEFMFNGMKYAVKLAEAATEHAQKLQAVVDKSQAHQTGLTKSQFDMKQAAAHIMSQYHPAVPLNTLPIPEDVSEREAIGNAYEGMADAWGASVAGAGALGMVRNLPAILRLFPRNSAVKMLPEGARFFSPAEGVASEFVKSAPQNITMSALRVLR